MKAETWQEHYDKHPDEGGKPSAERDKALHQPLIHAALDGVKPVPENEQKMAIVTMGAPASGKSSMLRGIDPTKFVKVDPDAIKEKIPEYKDATKPESTYRGAAAMVHEESSDIAKKILAGAIAQNKHVIVDGTGANAESMKKKIGKLKEAGYHVHLMYAHLDDADEGVKRINQRAESSGRYVPEKFARAAYKTIPHNFQTIAQSADSFVVHDSSRQGSPVVWEKSDGKETHHDPAFVAAFKVKHR
jgi:predicted ABC-type ATPase